ncbi:hypothetical protein EVAR_87326_1 [Eumeta japonica]|uniref:Uncharacterized protein n=1 Tax=Eumeta variegata TaxID=151549 RepID=A0A4C1SBN8_EUMVA|nr:hypothetical protein EVAR_87326_1 [Eumeta japonica]
MRDWELDSHARRRCAGAGIAPTQCNLLAHSYTVLYVMYCMPTFVNATMFLRITLDNRLQRGPHISVELARLVCFGCFYSVMSCDGISLWGDAADIHRILVLQKRAVRAIYETIIWSGLGIEDQGVQVREYRSGKGSAVDLIAATHLYESL